MRTISLLYLLKPALVIATPYFIAHPSKPEEPDVEPGSGDFWFHIIVAGILVLLGGVFAGLDDLKLFGRGFFR
jgi:hypothetical protein